MVSRAPAMGASVEEHFDVAILAARRKHRLTRDLGRNVVADLRQLALDGRCSSRHGEDPIISISKIAGVDIDRFANSEDARLAAVVDHVIGRRRRRQTRQRLMHVHLSFSIPEADSVLDRLHAKAQRDTERAQQCQQGEDASQSSAKFACKIR